MSRIRFYTCRLAILSIVWLAPAVARAQTSYPMTSRIDPVAVCRGQTVEIGISGTMSWNGAWALLCESPGLRGDVLKVETTQPAQTKAGAGGRRRGGASPLVRAKLEVDADCPLGPREVRVATSQGASSVGLVVVVDDPVITEADDVANDTPASAQKLSFPIVVSGRIGKLEDVDWYTFEAQRGQRITFEVWGNRLENKIHDLQTHLDPILSLHDHQGRELATADNTRFADPLLSFQVPSTGKYFLQVRDTTYTGNPAWVYALHAVTGPVGTAVFPMAVNPGTIAHLEIIGPGEDRPRTIDLPVSKNVEPGVQEFSLSAGGGSLPVPLVVTTLPVSTETGDTPAAGDHAQSTLLPVALCGRLGTQGDADGYRFEARKGVIYAFEVVARRAASECDPVIRVLDAKGSIVSEADDTRGLGKDARIEWKAPADGGFVLQVADLHDRGGMAFGYVLLAEAANPDFTLTCDPDLINVGPGGRVPVFVRLTRRNGFGGAVTLGWQGLPHGVTASPLSIAPSMTEGVIVVSAAGETGRSAALVNLEGTATVASNTIVRRAKPLAEIYLPGGGRGHFPVETLALAVTDPSDVAVEVSPRGRAGTWRLRPCSR